MDPKHFDRLAEVVGRRKLLGGALAGVLGLSTAKLVDVAAKDNKKAKVQGNKKAKADGKKKSKGQVGKEAVCFPGACPVGFCCTETPPGNNVSCTALTSIGTGTLPGSTTGTVVCGTGNPADPASLSGTCRTCRPGTRCAVVNNRLTCVCDATSCPNGCCAGVDAAATGGANTLQCIQNGSGVAVNNTVPASITFPFSPTIPNGAFVCGTGGGACNVCQQFTSGNVGGTTGAFQTCTGGGTTGTQGTCGPNQFCVNGFCTTTRPRVCTSTGRTCFGNAACESGEVCGASGVCIRGCDQSEICSGGFCAAQGSGGVPIGAIPIFGVVTPGIVAGPQIFSGCCSPTGVCQAGTATNACGNSGLPCTNCTTQFPGNSTVTCGVAQSCTAQPAPAPAPPCPAGLTLCGGLCVSVANNPQNCGTCGTVCPGCGRGRQTACIGGACGCTGRRRRRRNRGGKN